MDINGLSQLYIHQLPHGNASYCLPLIEIYSQYCRFVLSYDVDDATSAFLILLSCSTINHINFYKVFFLVFQSVMIFIVLSASNIEVCTCEIEGA